MDSRNAGTVLYCWGGLVPVGSYAQDEPVLVLPGWLGPREHDQIEQVTGGRVMKVDSGRVLQTRKYPAQFDIPADWVDRWSRHTLNGPAALTGEGWRSGPVRWSERAIRRLADTYPHDWQKSRVLFNWAADPSLQGRKMVPADLLVNEGFEDVLSQSLRGLGGGRGA